MLPPSAPTELWLRREGGREESASRPAVDHDWAGVRDALLLVVNLFQEVQHPARIAGDAVVRPGPEVVLPHGPLGVALGEAGGRRARWHRPGKHEAPLPPLKDRRRNGTQGAAD